MNRLPPQRPWGNRFFVGELVEEGEADDRGAQPPAPRGGMRGSRPGSRPPQQARSRETQRKLLDAAEAQLAHSSFDDLTVAAVVQAAELSPGAFYSRFRDKESLLQALETRAFEEMRELVEARLVELAAEPTAIERFLERLVATMVELSGRHRALLRTLILRSQVDPGLRARLAMFNLENERRIAAALGAALRAGGGVAALRDRAEHDAELEFAQIALRAVVRATVVFEDTYRQGTALDPTFVARETAELLAGYLGLRRAS